MVVAQWLSTRLAFKKSFVIIPLGAGHFCHFLIRQLNKPEKFNCPPVWYFSLMYFIKCASLLKSSN